MPRRADSSHHPGKRPSVLIPNAIVVAMAMAAGLVMSAQPALPTFSDVTKAAGIQFSHDSGAFGKKYLPETMGLGGAFLDADGDGWQDILLVNGMPWPGRPGRTSVMALYRNNQNGTFTDVTAKAGLAVPMYGIGAAAADYDNDGRVDIYVTALGRNRLFRNLGGSKFSDVTDAARVGDTSFSASAAWSDYDRDGRLDLFVANYVQWAIERDLFCTLDGKAKSYCTPEAYQGQSGTLYRPRRRHVRRRHRTRGREDPTARRLASPSSTTTTTGGSISSSPTTRSPTASTRTSAMARSPTSPSPPAWRSTRRAPRAPAWASTPPTSTDPAARASSSAISRTR